MPALLHRCLTKAICAEGDQMKHGLNWALSRRARLKIFDDHLECGDWFVQYADIQDAVLYSVRALFFLPGYVLRIKTGERTYHFGLNGGRYWRGDLPFLVRRERGTLGYSWLSLLLRAALIAYLLYSFWGWLNR